MRWTTKVLMGALLVISVYAVTQQRNMVLVVDGFAGEAKVVKVNGRPFVDVQALASITNGSLSFQGDRIVLMLPNAGARDGSAPTHAQEGFSREFMSASIEAIASMREWGSALMAAIQNGFPIGNSMATPRGRAVDALRLASAAAATDSDRSGLELLNQEFRNVENWSNKLVNARNSMSAANLTMSEDALKNDPLFQSIVRCGQFLGSMFAGGTFQDDGSCR